MKTRTNKQTETTSENQTFVKSGIYLKREELRRLSRQVMPHVKEGTYKNVNMALIEICYKNQGHEIFKSYDMWKLEGFQVKRGEKAFVIWSRPTTKEENDGEKIFRLAFLFSNLQVEVIQNNSKVEEPPVSYGLAEIQVTYTPTKVQFNPDKISSSFDVSEIFRNFFESFIEYREAFYVLYLNRANQPIGIYQLSLGGVSGTVADPKIALQIALKSHASGMVLAHNHPSGNLTPSEADKSLTKQIKNACGFLEISLLDHVILTAESYYSFADNGQI